MRVVDIDIDSQDPVVGPYDPQVTVVVADVDIATREQIREKVHDYEPEENGLEFKEASGERQVGESVPDEQIILTLSNGYTLRSGGQKYELGAYARICDEHGQEKVYWSAEEWQDAPEEGDGCHL